MVFNIKNTRGKKVKVFDQTGVEIKAVKKYNSRTREATILMTGITADGKTRVVTYPLTRKSTFPRKVLEIKVKIPGSFIVVNGKRF